MLEMAPDEEIMAGQLAGDFTLPRDKKKKLVFIAGGIGITPFRSMVKYLSDRGEKRDVTLLYSNRTTTEIAYRGIFDEAAKTIGLETIYAITGASEKPLLRQGPERQAPANYHIGHIDGALIRHEIPDYRDRIFYISGTHAMVSATETMLYNMGIPRTQIKTDFFPGFA
jgi:ferredoxin-NADP reductase